MQQTDYKEADATDSSATQQAPHGFTQELWQELERAQQLATLVSGWSGSMVSLAWLELRLALQNLPRILGLGLALVPLAGLTWVSLSLLLAWLAYAASGVATVGFVVLFALQLGVLLLCVWQLKRLRKQSSMPETREQWRLFLQELKHTPEAAPREENAANRP
jgi:uncharacterized membrane protein YqjE